MVPFACQIKEYLMLMTGRLMLICVLFCVLVSAPGAEMLDLSRATLVVRSGELPNAESAAATVLVEEIESRTGIQLSRSTEWPKNGAVIALS